MDDEVLRVARALRQLRKVVTGQRSRRTTAGRPRARDLEERRFRDLQIDLADGPNGHFGHFRRKVVKLSGHVDTTRSRGWRVLVKEVKGREEKHVTEEEEQNVNNGEDNNREEEVNNRGDEESVAACVRRAVDAASAQTQWSSAVERALQRSLSSDIWRLTSDLKSEPKDATEAEVSSLAEEEVAEEQIPEHVDPDHVLVSVARGNDDSTWSPYARFVADFGRQLLSAEPSLGRGSAEEVVGHLRARFDRETQFGRQEPICGRFGVWRARDHVDRVLAREMREEERTWLRWEREEREVVLRVSSLIFKEVLNKY